MPPGNGATGRRQRVPIRATIRQLDGLGADAASVVDVSVNRGTVPILVRCNRPLSETLTDRNGSTEPSSKVEADIEVIQVAE